ncbi:MAG: Crp/Fnr family transcriptional regulator [Caldilineaceae bacterium]|nr:Crp/Fnr family transcriptional regulator [Caldilineaceae bacterium]
MEPSQDPTAPLILTRLQNVSYLAELGTAILTELAAVASERTFVAGQAIFWEGEPVVGLYLVAEGIVKISRYSTEGREHILHLIHAGDTFNDVAALDGGPNPATASAYTNATIYLIPREDLRAIVNRHPDLAWALIESMARRARHLVNMVEDLSMRSVKGRLARLLLDQAVGNQSGAVPRLLTQEEMASRLGTVREMVGRALRSLAAEGIIEFDRHRIVILDAERLADIA